MFNPAYDSKLSSLACVPLVSSADEAQQHMRFSNPARPLQNWYDPAADPTKTSTPMRYPASYDPATETYSQAPHEVYQPYASSPNWPAGASLTAEPVFDRVPCRLLAPYEVVIQNGTAADTDATAPNPFTHNPNSWVRDVDKFNKFHNVIQGGASLETIQETVNKIAAKVGA